MEAQQNTNTLLIVEQVHYLLQRNEIDAVADIISEIDNQLAVEFILDCAVNFKHFN
jgi:hypothetical protein